MNDQIAHAILKVANELERQWDDGERAAMIDLHDLVAVLGAIADELQKEPEPCK